MVNLVEHEVGFDANSIGFPSIDACRAILLVTGGGLFGYHLAGGTLTDSKRDGFANFIVRGGAVAQRTLYLAAKINGGGNFQSQQEFWAEIRNLATNLNFTGPIFAADLSSFGASAYVRFDNVGNTTCIIAARSWDKAVDGAKANTIPNDNVNRSTVLGGARPDMYHNVSEAGLKVIYPIAVP
jgi:hypothetical protein